MASVTWRACTPLNLETPAPQLAAITDSGEYKRRIGEGLVDAVHEMPVGERRLPALTHLVTVL